MLIKSRSPVEWDRVGHQCKDDSCRWQAGNLRSLQERRRSVELAWTCQLACQLASVTNAPTNQWLQFRPTWFVVRYAFVRTNHRAFAMMFVCLSVCLGRTYIVIIRCILARNEVYGWIVQYSGHPDTKACPPAPNRLFPVLPGRQVWYWCAN